MAFDYHTYLASREWAVKREAVRTRCGNICERCHRAPHQQTHHLTYARVGHELLEDLLGVCRACHEFLSAKSDVDPAALPAKTKNIGLGAYEGGPNSNRIIRLRQVSQIIANRFLNWWPMGLWDYKGNLVVITPSGVPRREVRVIVGDAWEDTCEVRQNIYYNALNVIYNYQGEKDRHGYGEFGTLYDHVIVVGQKVIDWRDEVEN